MAIDDVLKLRAMAIPTTDEADVLRRACSLALGPAHDRFNTHYQAVALQSEVVLLVAADEQYYKKFVGLVCIVLLRDWIPSAQIHGASP